MPTKVKLYSQSKPGAVSRNLTRLREEAKMTRREMVSATGFGKTTVEKMELVYEPPANHPFLPVFAKALAPKLARDESAVLLEIRNGGKDFEFGPRQLSRIYGAHPHLAPADFGVRASISNKNTTKKSANGKPVKSRIGKNRIGGLITFLDADKKVATAAKLLGISLPHAKRDSTGKLLQQDDRSIKMRALRLRTMLKATGMDVDDMMDGGTTKPMQRRKKGYRDIAGNTYEMTCRFNQARMLGDTEITVRLDVLEPMLRDYLTQTGVGAGALLNEDIEKLIPKK